MIYSTLAARLSASNTLFLISIGVYWLLLLSSGTSFCASSGKSSCWFVAIYYATIRYNK
jgi:hypothetical protein